MPQTAGYSVYMSDVLTPGQQQDAIAKRETERLTLQLLSEKRRQELQQMQQEQDTNRFLQDAVQRHTDPQTGLPDFDAIEAEAYQRDPRLGEQIAKQNLERRKGVIDLRLKDIENETKSLQLGRELLPRITDQESLNAFLPHLQKIDPHLAQGVGSVYTPETQARIDAMVAASRTDEERLSELKVMLGNDPHTGLLQQLVTAPDAEVWDDAFDGIAAVFNPRVAAALRKQLGDFTPENQQRLQTMLGQTEATAAKRTQAEAFEDDYLAAGAAKLGKTPDALTADERVKLKTEARRIFGQADDPVRGIQITVGGQTPPNNPMPSEWKNAIERAILFVPKINRDNKVALMNRLWAEGNTAELADVIRQSAIEGENVDTKNQVRGRDLTLNAIQDVRGMLEDLKKTGAPTNFFTGNMEDLARKLGTSTNPAYATLAARVNDLLVQYRRAATGVQFSERESRDYERMFPNYRQTLPVNIAVLQGLEHAVKANQDSFWKSKLGASGAALIFGQSAKKAPNDPMGIR